MPNSEELRYLGDAVNKLGDIAKAVTERAAGEQLLQYKIDALDGKVEQLVDVVSQQAKIIRDFENERHEDKGAHKAIKFVWSALVIGVSGVAYMLHDVVVYFLPPRH